MERQEQNFITLLSQAIQLNQTGELQAPSYSEILKLADSHAVTSLLYPALKKNLPFGDPILAGMKKYSFSAATRESIQGKELGQIFSACKENQIPILPLKGCVIKALYPYPELRFMSDADLLIRDEDGDKMRKLMEELGHRFHKVDAGDTDVYVSPLHMNYEIHRGLEGEGFSESSRRFTESLLDMAHPGKENPYLLELPPVEHYVYILCHFIKHFIYGGVGVRQLADLYICYNHWKPEKDKLDALLESLDLSEFHDRLKALWRYWFSGGQADSITEELSSYILHSGVFGNEAQRSTDRLLSEGQEKNYFFARLFPPFRVMKGYFPILKRAPFLLPVFWLWRAIRAVLFRRKKLRSELNAVANTDSEALDKRRTFYHQCGLSVYSKES